LAVRGLSPLLIGDEYWMSRAHPISFMSCEKEAPLNSFTHFKNSETEEKVKSKRAPHFLVPSYRAILLDVAERLMDFFCRAAPLFQLILCNQQSAPGQCPARELPWRLHGHERHLCAHRMT
jgi:hypothetical protein